MGRQHRWIRVNKAHPCPVCKHPDWCTYTDDGTLILCMRVQSDKPSTNAMGGWLHRDPNAIDDGFWDRTFTQAPPLPKKEEEITPQFKHRVYDQWSVWRKETQDAMITKLARDLGDLSAWALNMAGAAFAKEHRAWAFPMQDENRDFLGIRFRADDGSKWTLKGTHPGLFMLGRKCDYNEAKILYIVEGITDLCTMVTMGAWAIGRPQCSGFHDLVVRFIRKHPKIERVVLIADNDDAKPQGVEYPGLEGAKRLQEALPLPSVVWMPPVVKDLRAFYSELGGELEDIEGSISDKTWRVP